MKTLCRLLLIVVLSTFPLGLASIFNKNSIKVGVFLPMQTLLGQRLWTAITMALYDSHNTSITLIPYDTQTPLNLLVQRAKTDNIQAIIGPLYGNNLKKLKPLLAGFHIPVFSLSNKSYYASKGFWTFGYNLADQMEYLTQYLRSKNINQVLVLFPKNEYGYTLSNFLNQYQSNNTFIISKYAFYSNKKSTYPAIVRKLLNTTERSKTIQANIKNLYALYRLKLKESKQRMNKLYRNIKIIEPTLSNQPNRANQAFTDNSPTPPPPISTEFKNTLTATELNFLETVETNQIQTDNLNTQQISNLPWEKIITFPLGKLKKWIKNYKNNPDTGSIPPIHILLLGDNSSNIRALSEIIAFMYKTPSKVHFYGLAPYENMPLLSSEPSMLGSIYVTANQYKTLKYFQKRFQKLTHTPTIQIDTIAYIAMNTYLNLKQNNKLKTIWTNPVTLTSLNGPIQLSPTGEVRYTYDIIRVSQHARSILSQTKQ